MHLCKKVVSLLVESILLIFRYVHGAGGWLTGDVDARCIVVISAAGALTCPRYCLGNLLRSSSSSFLLLGGNNCQSLHGLLGYVARQDMYRGCGICT